MKKKNYIVSMLMLSASIAINAQSQIYYNGFEEVVGTDTTAVGWYKYLYTQDGDERDIAESNQHSGSYCCHFYNANTEIGSYARAIKFRNIPLKDRTSYRLSFYLKGDETYSVDGLTDKKTSVRANLNMGIDGSNVMLFGGDSTKYDYTVSNIQSDYKKYTMMFYNAGASLLKTYYNNHKGDLNELPDNYFLSMNLYSPGDFYLDDVSVNESSIAGVTYSADAIKVNFGYDTNISTLAKAKTNGKLEIGSSCVNVNLNGKNVEVTSVELWKDSCMYIFLGDEYPQSADDKVLVSFTNPTGKNEIKYTGKLRPNALVEGDDSVARNFTNEAGEYDETLTAMSAAYDPPTFVSADPENGSFDLPLTTNSIKMVFDRPVDVSKARATLTGGSIKKENLLFTPSTGYADTITLTRSGSTSLTQGEYTINMTKIIGKLSYGDDIYNEVNLTLNLGTVEADPNDTTYVVWKDSFDVKGKNYVPEGWTIYGAGNEISSGSKGSGPRIIQFNSGGDFMYGLYTRNGGWTGTGYAEFGLIDGYLLTLKSGKHQLKYNAASWTQSSSYIKCEIFDASDEVVASSIDACSPNMGGNSSNVVSNSTAVNIEFNALAGNYKVKWTPVNDDAGNLTGVSDPILGNISLTYIPNAAGVYYKTMLANALTAAKTCLADNAEERYVGGAYNDLSRFINEYDGKSFTAPSSYLNATSELTTATTTLNNHRMLIDTYDPLVTSAQTLLDTYVGTKYAGDSSYSKLQNVENLYKDNKLTDDKELKIAIDSLNYYVTYCTNMCKYVIPDLTARLTKSVSLATNIGISSDDASVTAANNAITDDDNVADALNTVIRHRIYDDIVDGTISFETKIDENTLEEYKDTFDLTGFIKNPNLYAGTLDKYDMNDGVCPGWNITKGTASASGSMNWSSGYGNYYVTRQRPYSDVMITSNLKQYDLHQTITGLPIGVYSVMTGFCERNSITGNTPYQNYFYVTTSNTKDSLMAPTEVTSFPTNNMWIDSVVVTDGKMTIGVRADSLSHTYVNNFSIYLKNKIAGFDYTTSIKGVSDQISNGEIKEVEYYTPDGRRITNIENNKIVIKKYKFKDGSVKIRKETIK